MPLPRIVSAGPNRRRDGGLAVVGLLVLLVGFGTFLPAFVFLALAVLWWGRAFGVGALFALAVALAAWMNVGGPASRRIDPPSPVAETPWAP